MTVESKEEVVEEFRQRTILAAAMRVIARRGPSAVTMQQIAAEAGIAKGTIYLYYSNRDELMEKASDFAFSELLSRIEAVIAKKSPLKETLRALVSTKIAFFDENQEFLRVYIATRHPEAACASDARKRHSRPQYRRYQELLAQALEAAMERGEARRMDATRLATFFMEGTSAILLRRLESKAPPADDDVDWIVGLMLNGLLSKQGRA
jgi:AcrR family transcriptional regulator